MDAVRTPSGTDGSPRDVRSKNVSAAYWIWIVCAAILVFFGLLAVTTSADAIREQLAENGKADNADSFLRLLRGSGILSVIVGVAIGLLAAPVRSGDDRFRRAIVALSASFGLLQIAGVILGVSPGILLLVPVLLMTAGILVYRQSSNDWFVDGS